MATDSSGKSPTEPTGALRNSSPPQSDLSVHPDTAALMADGVVMRRLRADLDAIASEYCQSSEPDAPIELTRQHITAVLNSLYRNLKLSLGRQSGLIGPDGDDEGIKFDHPTMSLLRDFIDALGDLDNHNKHELFKSTYSSRGASLTKSEKRKRDELLLLVDLIQIVKGLPTIAAAERELEKMMRKHLGRSGAIVTANQLKEFRRTRNRQRRRAQK